MKNRKLSPSLLAIPCERALKLALKKTPPEIVSSDEAEFGKEIHALIQSCVEKEDFSELQDYLEIRGDPVEAWRPFKPLKKDWEKWIEFKYREYTVLGRIDCIAYDKNTDIIIDTKTRYHATVLPTDKRQLEIYAYPSLLSGKNVKLYVYFPVWSAMVLVEELSGISVIEKIERRLTREINKCLKVWNKYNPYPQPSSYCYWCSYVLSCPKKVIGVPTNQEEAIKLAEEYIKLDAQLKSLTKILKSYVAKNGNIETTENIVGFFPTQTKIVDEKNLQLYVKQKGIDFTELYKPDLRKIVKLSKQNEDLVNFVYVVNKEGNFSIKKKKDNKSDEE